MGEKRRFEKIFYRKKTQISPKTGIKTKKILVLCEILPKLMKKCRFAYSLDETVKMC